MTSKWPENNTPDGLVSVEKVKAHTPITFNIGKGPPDYTKSLYPEGEDNVDESALNDPHMSKGQVEKLYSDEQLKKSDGTKHDGDKLRLDLIDPIFEAYTAMALGFGADKYGDGNWLKGIQWSRIYGALRRHLRSWYEGEEIDMESNNPHLAHAAAMLMMLCRYSSDPSYNHLDDRLFKREEYPDDLLEK